MLQRRGERADAPPFQHCLEVVPQVEGGSPLLSRGQALDGEIAELNEDRQTIPMVPMSRIRLVALLVLGECASQLAQVDLLVSESLTGQTETQVVEERALATARVTQQHQA